MRLTRILLPLALAGLAPAAALAAEGEPVEAVPAVVKADASIAFANHGGVWNWRADDYDTIYFQDRRKRWYRAKLVVAAYDLPWAQEIGIETGAGGRLDRWGAIVVEGRKYGFVSFDEVDGPPPKRRDRLTRSAKD